MEIQSVDESATISTLPALTAIDAVILHIFYYMYVYVIYIIIFTPIFYNYIQAFKHDVFPYRVDICSEDIGVFCMGIYLKDVWVITTKYCVSQVDFIQKPEVVIGNTGIECRQGERRSVVNATQENDDRVGVVLLQISKPFTPISSIISASIKDGRTSEDIALGQCIVYSYYYQKDLRKSPDRLGVSSALLIGNGTCAKWFPNLSFDPLRNLCAKGVLEVQPSSSPFICNGSLVGIVIDKSIVDMMIFKIDDRSVLLNVAKLRLVQAFGGYPCGGPNLILIFLSVAMLVTALGKLEINLKLVFYFSGL